MVDLNKEQIQMFHRKMMEMAKNADLFLERDINSHHFVYGKICKEE